MRVITTQPARHIGPAIKRARELAGLTQAELAALVGRTKRAISHHERGASQEISQELLEQIAVACGTTTEALWRMAAQGTAAKKMGRPKKCQCAIDLNSHVMYTFISNKKTGQPAPVTVQAALQ